MIKRNRLSFVSAFFAASLIMPINHIYNYHAAVGHLPLILGLASTLCACVCLGIVLVGRLHSKPYHLMGGVVLFFVYVSAVVAIANLTEGGDYSESVRAELLSMDIRAIVQGVIYFIIGLYLFSNKPSSKPVTFFWALMVINTFIFTNYSEGMLDLSAAGEQSDGVYLFLGDSFALWSILVVSLAEKWGAKIIFITISMVTLYFIGSRSSLYAFTASALFVFPFFMPLDKFYLYKAYLIAFVLVMLALLLIAFSPSNILDSRMLRFIFEGQDSSWSFRLMQLSFGLNDIIRNPVFGTYGGQVKMSGTTGNYIHNYLEVWRQFGIFPFVLIVTMAISVLKRSWRYLRHDNDWEGLAVAFVAIFCVIEISFARSWGTPYIFLAIGLCASKDQRSTIMVKK